MALSANFSTQQTPGSPENIIFVDESSGSDGAVTKRRIYIQAPNGDFLVESGNDEDYSEWDGFPGTTTITLEDILTKDYGCRVVVQWLNSSDTVLYDKTSYIGFNCYNEDFDYSLTQNVASNQLLMSDNNFWGNKTWLQTLIDSGDKAIERASDINACQQCYDMATSLRLNAQYAFNQNS